jgi:hypothetical protein
VKSRFHLIRRVKENASVFPDSEKLFIIVLVNVDGNSEAVPAIDSRTTELPKIKATFKSLQDKFPDTLVVEYVESAPYSQVKQEVEAIYKMWETQYGQKPCYVVHYLGHSMLENQVGKLVIKNADSGKPDWVEDKKFASLFSEDKLNVKQPSMVCFQACDSAKIGSFDENLRGVAYEFTKINIPAVIGMQNEIDTPYSNAFFGRFYESILKAGDVAEAVTTGRDYLGREFKMDEDAYINNSFGSPVLFITTQEPVRLMKAEMIQDQVADVSSKITDLPGSARLFAKSDRAGERQKDVGIIGVTRAGLKNDSGDWQGSAAQQDPVNDNSAPVSPGMIDSRDTAAPVQTPNPTDI